MRVVIAGGTGIIGKALTSSLAASGNEVVLLSRSPKQSADLPAGVRAERWDGRTVGDWARLIDGAGAIVNLAGESLSSGPWTAERKRQISRSRVDSGAALVEAVKKASQRPRVLIQSSAVGYYGPRNDEVVAEDAAPGNDFLARVCIDWERSTAPVEDLGVRRVVIRTGVVLSMEGGALPRLVLPSRLFAGGPLGSGDQWFPWIHIADEVAAIRFLIENDSAQGPFNLVAPNPLTNAKFSLALGRVLGRPALLRTPAFALRLIFGEMASVVLEGQRAVPRRLLGLGFQFRFSEVKPALRELLES